MIRFQVIIFLILACSNLFASTLVLSSKLKLEYPEPLLISHTEDKLIFKYKDAAIVHNIVNPKTMYANTDLSGFEKPYIYALFDRPLQLELPLDIQQLAVKQRTHMGLDLSKGNIQSEQNFEILSSYDERRKIGHVFIIEELRIHHIAVDGSQDFLEEIIDSIGVR
jgi:hypothetical protein